MGAGVISSCIKMVDELLAPAGLTQEAVMAETLAARLDDIERIERMIGLTEARRAAALREIDRHRAVLAEKLEHATQALDAEYRDVATPAATQALAS